MSKNIFLISGYSCSGKTTLIKAMNSIYQMDLLKFGSVHKECVKNNGYLYAKDWIKAKGFNEYERNLIELFKKKIDLIIKNSDRPLIIDGIFSNKCFDYLRELDSIVTKNIVLNVDIETRIKRMMIRENLDYESAKQHLLVTDCIKQKAGIANVLQDYDYIINGETDIEKIKNIYMSVLCKKQNIEANDMEERV